MWVRSIQTGYGIQPPATPRTSSPSGSGTIYWNNSNGACRVVDQTGTVQGGAYDIYPADVFLQLDNTTMEIIEWAKKKKDDEARVIQFILENPNLAEVYEQYKILMQLAGLKT